MGVHPIGRILALLTVAVVIVLAAMPAQAELSCYFASFGGQQQYVGKYPLEPISWGTMFAATATDARGLNAIGDSLYWIEDTALWTQKFDGSGRTRLNTFLASPLNLAVDVGGGYCYAAFATTMTINRYALTAAADGVAFTATATDAASLTLAGEWLYWLEGPALWNQKLDGSGRTLLRSFDVAPLDLAVDTVGGRLYASFGGGELSIKAFSLASTDSGEAFATTATDARSLTLAGDSLYWLEGPDVWAQKLDSGEKTLLQNFGTAPLDLAVHVVPIPEPATVALLLSGLGLLSRRRKH